MSTRREAAPRARAAEPAAPDVRRAPARSQDAVLALQRAAGNRAFAVAVARERGLARWRDFSKAHGTAQYDYKIVEGTHPTAGKYHLKFHAVGGLDAFDEIHVVFEGKDPRAYFFFDDDGTLLTDKSHSGLKHPELRPIAEQLVAQQLATSERVPDDVIAAKKQALAAQQAKDDKVKAQHAAEVEAQAQARAKSEAQAREASKAAADEEQHIANFLKDMGLGLGEQPAFVAYLDGTGPPRDYWRVKADWYKAKRVDGWKVELPSRRVAKAQRLTPEAARKELGAGPEAIVRMKATKSGPSYFYDAAEVTFPNYTSYAASKAERPAP